MTRDLDSVKRIAGLSLISLVFAKAGQGACLRDPTRQTLYATRLLLIEVLEASKALYRSNAVCLQKIGADDAWRVRSVGDVHHSTNLKGEDPQKDHCDEHADDQDCEAAPDLRGSRHTTIEPEDV